MLNYQNIITQIQLDITELFATKLPKGLYYHDLRHTAFVVEASQQIGKALAVSQEELDILAIAAWWHDTGYIKTVKGHEAESQAMAKNYLQEKALDEEIIKQVLGCIAATQIPQSPKNLLEEIICDADLAHLATRDFVARCRPLRKEWDLISGKKMTETEWLEVNESFMGKHTYFTEYGKDVLSIQKSRNLRRITKKLHKIRITKAESLSKTQQNLQNTKKILDTVQHI